MLSVSLHLHSYTFIIPTRHCCLVSSFIRQKYYIFLYIKTCVKRLLKIDKTKILITNGSLMKVKSIAECSPWSILQYFWPALSDNWSWKPIFGHFETGSITQVLLYYSVSRPCLAFYLFSQTCLMNLIKHDHSCKILYLVWWSIVS